MHKIVVILIIGIIQVSALKCDGKSSQSSTETILKRELFCDYDQSMRPREYGEMATNFTMSVYVKDVSYFGHIQGLMLYGFLIFVSDFINIRIL